MVQQLAGGHQISPYRCVILCTQDVKAGRFSLSLSCGDKNSLKKVQITHLGPVNDYILSQPKLQ